MNAANAMLAIGPTAVVIDIPLDCGLLWEALTRDSGADVALIDADGTILRLNEPTRYWPFTQRQAGGKRLDELLAPDVAVERMAVVRRCFAEHRPLAIETVWRGVPVRTVLRPYKTPEGRVLILATCRASQENDGPGSPGEGIETIRTLLNDAGPLAKLTPREIEVLALIAQGHTTAQIAKMLFRSAKTIEAHRLSLGLKLKVKNRVELTRIAMKAGLHHAKVATPVSAPTAD